MPFPRSDHLAMTAIFLGIGGIGGWVFSLLHMPLPWLMGAMVFVTATSMGVRDKLPKDYVFPHKFRNIFIAVIGIMIGVQVQSDMLERLGDIALSLAFITAFVPLAHASNYWVFRRIGGYDRASAYFCSAPGGLIEALTMGEQSGAQVSLLVMQQFLRIIGVIVIIPVGISLWVGAPVGSAAGFSGALPQANIPDWQLYPALIAVGLSGAYLGATLHLPAGHLVGPLLVTLVIDLSGVAQLSLPVWWVIVSQIVIGSSLGLRFLTLRLPTLAKGIFLSIVSVSLMLAIGGIMALILWALTDTSFMVLLISFAPGGVTEMSLIALSLAANPAFVTIHHIYRIILTVLQMGYGWRWISKA